MPKKGLIAIPGTISASGSDGLGLMQMPPVSENTEHNKADYKTAHDLYFLLNESYKKTKHNTEVVHFFEVTFSIID